MPKCLYIICSESGSEDKATGMYSLFNLFDKLQFSHTPNRSSNVAPLAQMRVTSLWMRESGDDNKEFDFEVVFHPPQGEEIKMAAGSFIFNTPFYRMTIRLLGLPLIKGEGMLWIESRIRKTESKTWNVFKSPILIERLPEISPMVTEQQESSTNVDAKIEPKENSTST